MEVELTIPDFCKKNRISRGHYYNLKAQGKAPQELRLGRRVIIPHRCAQEWEAKMLAEQNAQPSRDENHVIRSI